MALADFRNRSGRNDNSPGGGSLGRAPRPHPIGLNAVTPFCGSWAVSPLFHEDGQILLFPAPINYLWGDWLAEAAFPGREGVNGDYAGRGLICPHQSSPLSFRIGELTHIDRYGFG
jgi:hypothetical protein